MKKPLLLAVALLVATTACGSGSTDAESTPKSTTTLSDDSAASEEPTMAEPNVGARALRVGETRVGTDFTMTLAEIKYPFPAAEYRDPEAGNVFVGFRLKECVKPGSKVTQDESLSSYNGDWYVVTPDGEQIAGNGSSWNDFPRPKFPETVAISAGECFKGWILSEVPKGTKIKKIAYRPGGYNAAEWLP